MNDYLSIITSVVWENNINLPLVKISCNSEIKQMDRSVDEERGFNGNVSVTTSLNTQAEQDVRVLATVYTIYKIGEFYTVVYQTFYFPK